MQVIDPGRHALRGFSVALAAGTAVSTVLGNRRVLFSLSLSRLWALRVFKPTRNTIAIAIFVGIFRLVERLEQCRKGDRHEGPTEKHVVEKALVVASLPALLCADPSSRTPVIALLSTNAASMWFNKVMEAHPELRTLKPLDLIVFMMSSGWILYSGLFHPESYEPSHMKLIMKYTLTTPEAAEYLQTRYKDGLNPNTCEARHPGRECGEFFLSTFVKQCVAMGFRVYFPVHFTTWILALRSRKVRSKPLVTQLETLVTRVVRSAMYFIVYVLVGWTLPCYTNAVGGRSLLWRKLQFLVSGSLPALALLFESPSRRRPIGVILTSYAFISMGTVLSRKNRLQWLQQGSGPVRTLLDIAAFAAALAYTTPSLIDDSPLLQRLLFGASKPVKNTGAVESHPK